MKSCFSFGGWAGVFVLSSAVLGCGEPEVKKPTSTKPPAKASGKHDHAHDEDAKGPHGGSLIELGEEKYHAELVHDEDAKTVTVYILDGDAKKSVAIEASEVTINLKHDGAPEQFKLAAAADASDPEGKSSKFTSSDAELAEDLDHEGADAQLVVDIEGKQYRGDVGHGDHEHK